VSRRLSTLVLVALLAGLLGIPAAPAHAGTFEVNSALDDLNTHDSTPGDGFCSDGYGACSLRAAIEEANTLAGADTIEFTAPMTITIDTSVGALPALSEAIIIDASEEAVLGRPGVILDGGGGSFDGLYLSANACEIYGLHITHFGANGIHAVSAYNVIGGPNPGQRNVISNSGANGILLSGSSAHHNVIQNNWIGIALDGQTAAPNFGGVAILSGAHDNVIGGESAGIGNYISGNTYNGVYMAGSGTEYNRLGDNSIGLTPINSLALGNGQHGVLIDAGSQYTSLGVTPMRGNTIRNNGGSGVYIEGATHTHLTSNTIADNGGDGVRVEGAGATGNEIEMNSIHHNGGQGIALVDGANDGIAAPVITNANASSATGTACPGCTVRIYSDSQDEGETYEGWAGANASGTWFYSGVLGGPNVTATSTDEAASNTSEFSAPYAVAAPSGTCANPLPIACGQQVSGDTSAYANNHDGYTCGWDATGPEVIYGFTLPAGSSYNVTAELLSFPSGQDLDLYLLAAGGCDAGQCLQPDSCGDVEATARSVPPGTYYVSVDGYGGASGTFDLRLTCTAVRRMFLPLVTRKD
jgi:CSLREA domain-containing protein